MDPLFGFIDDITVQHPEENNAGVGEYTISYPNDQSQQQFQLHHSNAQFSNNTTDSSAAQVVHVVSENSQNEKQIYVIKLENFLKDDRNPDDTTIKFEGAETEEQANNEVKVNLNQGDGFNPGLSSSTESSSNEEEEEDPNQEQEQEEPGPDPQIA